VTDSGTSWNFSSRFCAVTTISVNDIELLASAPPAWLSAASDAPEPITIPISDACNGQSTLVMIAAPCSQTRLTQVNAYVLLSSRILSIALSDIGCNARRSGRVAARDVVRNPSG
jgi:hypothetical protein